MSRALRVVKGKKNTALHLGTSRRWRARFSLAVFYFESENFEKNEILPTKNIGSPTKGVGFFFFEVAEKSQKSDFFRIHQ